LLELGEIKELFLLQLTSLIINTVDPYNKQKMLEKKQKEKKDHHHRIQVDLAKKCGLHGMPRDH
jgi:hypothetical protein